MALSSIVPQANDDQTHSTMMAWRVHEFGPPNVMRFERVSRPNPGPGEVLVKVEAAGVGPGTAGLGPERALCRNRSPSLWARNCLVKSSPRGQGFLRCVWESRFMV